MTSADLGNVCFKFDLNIGPLIFKNIKSFEYLTSFNGVFQSISDEHEVVYAPNLYQETSILQGATDELKWKKYMLYFSLNDVEGITKSDWFNKRLHA